MSLHRRTGSQLCVCVCVCVGGGGGGGGGERERKIGEVLEFTPILWV